VFTVRVYDTSSERKTAENLVKYILDVKEHLEMSWGVIVVAVTSDASGDSRKARKMVVKQMPYLVAPDCYAHQV
jgi:hypothetical protein